MIPKDSGAITDGGVEVERESVRRMLSAEFSRTRPGAGQKRPLFVGPFSGGPGGCERVTVREDSE